MNYEYGILRSSGVAFGFSGPYGETVYIEGSNLVEALNKFAKMGWRVCSVYDGNNFLLERQILDKVFNV